MIDFKNKTDDRKNGHAPGKSGRAYDGDHNHEHAADSEEKRFNSFQHIAEQTMREQKQTSALTLTDESAAMFRALPLAQQEVEKMRSEIQVLHQRHGTLSLGIASAHNGEGTSTILANLVLDFKRTDLRILVVDLNIRHPNLAGLFSLPNGPGLIDLMQARQKFSDVVRVVKSNKIFLLPLGMPGKATRFELETAVRAINKAGKNSQYFDLIFFDFPPLNEVPQALFAARQVDGLIQIVQAERTRIEVVRTLRASFDHHGIRLFGVVFNQRRYYIPKSIYKNL
ncbi:MAG: CpsD/CapB family tyrosine-protein kinase [candidate division KSB1 bacterium]